MQSKPVNSQAKKMFCFSCENLTYQKAATQFQQLHDCIRACSFSFFQTIEMLKKMHIYFHNDRMLPLQRKLKTERIKEFH